MRFEDLTTTPPLATVRRSELIDVCLRAVSQRELVVVPPGDGGAAGDAAKAETLVLKAFFDALGTRLAAVATAQDAIV
jgi:hypothetical protein